MIPKERYPKRFKGKWTSITNVTEDIIRFECKLQECDKYRAIFTNGKGEEISLLQRAAPTCDKFEILEAPLESLPIRFDTYKEAEACIKMKLLILDGRKFRMWAVDRGNYYWGVGYEMYAKCYATHETDRVTEVNVIINPEGTYWAMYKKEDDKLHMIYPNKNLFNMCFPYGPKDEEERGRGKIVNCCVEEIKDANHME